MNHISSNAIIRPRYLSTLHSRYYRLPIVLWDYIWMYDNRYHTEFKFCISELNKKFKYNRLITRISHEINLYNIYKSQNIYHILNYSDYILYKIKKFGDNITCNYLNSDKCICPSNFNTA